MQNKKGFTLIELVVVIAVIAILAGVMIGTFASVVNRANESARMQEMKAAEIEQKANDVIEKMNNSNWLGWEDFEVSLVSKMTQLYKENAVHDVTITSDDVKTAVKAALKEYTDSQAIGNTGLTEEQVKTIIEDAVGKIKYNGVTEAQVKAIVTQAVSAGTANQLTAAQVKSIVNAANANNLTANDVSLVVANLGLATTTGVNSAVTQITSALSEATSGALTTQDLEDALISLLPVTFKVASASDLTKALGSVNSFSTLEFSKDFGAVTIETNRAVTLTITGVSLENLTVNAPLATIYLSTNVGTVTVTSVADNSLHVTGTVQALEIKQGRVVVEGKVEELTAAPAANAVVTVAVQPAAVVTSLEVELQKNGETSHETIAVENSGTVASTVVTSTGDATVSTNIIVNNNIASTGATASTIADAAKSSKVAVEIVDTEEKISYKVTVSGNEAQVSTTTDVDTSAKLLGSGTEADPFVIRTADELVLASTSVYSQRKENDAYIDTYFVLGSDIDISDRTWAAFEAYKIHIDGANHTINGLNNKASFEYKGATITNISSGFTGENYGFISFSNGNCSFENISFTDVNIDMSKNGNNVATIIGTARTLDGNTTISMNAVKVSGSIKGVDKVGGFVGASAKGSDTTYQNVDYQFSACVNACDILVVNTAKYSRAGGFVGQINSTKTGEDCNTKFISCVNSGDITIKSLCTKAPMIVGALVGHSLSEEAGYYCDECENNGKITTEALAGSKDDCTEIGDHDYQHCYVRLLTCEDGKHGDYYDKQILTKTWSTTATNGGK